jgi:hypothetical protein
VKAVPCERMDLTTVFGNVSAIVPVGLQVGTARSHVMPSLELSATNEIRMQRFPISMRFSWNASVAAQHGLGGLNF